MDSLAHRIGRISRLVAALERTEALSRARVACCERVLAAVRDAQEACRSEAICLSVGQPRTDDGVAWEQQRARAAELLSRRASRYAGLQARLALRLARRQHELQETQRTRRVYEKRMEELGHNAEEAARVGSQREADWRQIACQARDIFQ